MKSVGNGLWLTLELGFRIDFQWANPRDRILFSAIFCKADHNTVLYTSVAQVEAGKDPSRV